MGWLSAEEMTVPETVISPFGAAGAETGERREMVTPVSPPFNGIAQRFVEHRVEDGPERCVLECRRDRTADVDVLVLEEDRVAGLPLHLLQHRFQRNAPEGFGDGFAR